MTDHKWVEKIARQIQRDAKQRYGNGWDLMSEDAQSNYIEARVLNVILSQALPDYSAAQETASAILSHVTK